MNLNYNFRNLQWSDELVDYVESRFQKLHKFEVKPVHVHVTLCVERHERKVEVYARGGEAHFQAQATSDNFFEAIDKALQRMAKQMSKKKAKLKSHKCYERTHVGRMERLTPQMEYVALDPEKKEVA